ncbi:hypothetical protein ES705_48688 [subsurface metagenome]
MMIIIFSGGEPPIMYGSLFRISLMKFPVGFIMAPTSGSGDGNLPLKIYRERDNWK